MSTTLLAEYDRKARKAHVCQLCHRAIAQSSRYREQRVAYDGTVYAFRAHHACHSAYWSWVHDEAEDCYDLTDLTPHLPPCWHAWDHDTYRFGRFEPFIGPRPPCTCDAGQ